MSHCQILSCSDTSKRKCSVLNLILQMTLFDGMRVKFQKTSSELLEQVFESWSIQLQNRIECQGGCFSENHKACNSISSKIAFQIGRELHPTNCLKKSGSNQ
jgi:hypothetical protein